MSSSGDTIDTESDIRSNSRENNLRITASVLTKALAQRSPALRRTVGYRKRFVVEDGGRLPELKLRPVVGREVTLLFDLDEVWDGERSYCVRMETAVTTDFHVALVGAMHAV